MNAMNAMLFLTVKGGGKTGEASIGKFLQSFQETLANYGSIAVSIIGVAMVVVAIYQIAKGLMSGGKGQTNWVMTIALLLIGGALALTSGWKTVGQLVKTGNVTLSEMAEGSADTQGKVSDPFGSSESAGGTVGGTE